MFESLAAQICWLYAVEYIAQIVVELIGQKPLIVLSGPALVALGETVKTFWASSPQLGCCLFPHFLRELQGCSTKPEWKFAQTIPTAYHDRTDAKLI